MAIQAATIIPVAIGASLLGVAGYLGVKYLTSGDTLKTTKKDTTKTDTTKTTDIVKDTKTDTVIVDPGGLTAKQKEAIKTAESYEGEAERAMYQASQFIIQGNAVRERAREEYAAMSQSLPDNYTNDYYQNAQILKNRAADLRKRAKALKEEAGIIVSTSGIFSRSVNAKFSDEQECVNYLRKNGFIVKKPLWILRSLPVGLFGTKETVWPSGSELDNCIIYLRSRGYIVQLGPVKITQINIPATKTAGIYGSKNNILAQVAGWK